MLRSFLPGIDDLESLPVPDNMRFALLIDQNNIGPECNELHPLCHIIGSNRMDHKMIAFVEKGEHHIFPDNIDIHTKGTI
jgi:hypothetical protein